MKHFLGLSACCCLLSGCGVELARFGSGSPGSGACEEPSARKNLFTGGRGAWTSSSSLWGLQRALRAEELVHKGLQRALRTEELVHKGGVGGGTFFRSPGSGACKEPSGRKNLFTRAGGGVTSSSALQALGPAKSPQDRRTCSQGGGGGGGVTSSSALQALGPAKRSGGGDKFFRSPGSGACKEPSGRKNLFTRAGGGVTSSSALQALGPAKSPQDRRTCSQGGGGGGGGA